MKRLAIITTHPIQYNAPLFALLSNRGVIEIKIFYTWGDAVLENKFDPGFNKAIHWDIPLLHGYDHCFVKNAASQPGSHHFNGIDNPDLIDHILNWKADAILVYGWSFKSHLKAMRYFAGRIPVIFRGDSTLLGKTNPVKELVRTILLRWVYRKVNAALYVGTNNKEYFLKYGLQLSQLYFAPHAIDNDRFAIQPEALEKAALEWRRNLGINDKAIVFLFAAKLTEDKNAGLLLHAFCSLANPGIHLIIAGSGAMEGELKAAYSGIDNIHFLPFQNQTLMPVLYRLGDVFVHPSKSNSETWGLSINEAMACARPVLASDKCGAAIDLIKSGGNGYIFQSGNVEMLAEQMKLISGNPAALKLMGPKSAEIISAWNFTNICVALEGVTNALTKHN